MSTPNISDTQGKILNRLSTGELNDELNSWLQASRFEPLDEPITFETECDTTTYQSYGDNRTSQITVYKKTEQLAIVTSTVMDIGYYDEIQGYLSPTLDELLQHIKTDPRIAEIIEENIVNQITSSDDIEKEITSIPIYIPLASTYRDLLGIKHSHFRGILLEAGLNEEGDFDILESTLIDSRGPIFGRNAPSSFVKKAILEYFPETKFKKIFTGHQSVLTGDNDSCGYRTRSYGVQIAKGVKPKELIDDVLCSTKTKRWFKNLLPNIWHGTKAIWNKIFSKSTPAGEELSQPDEQEITGSRERILEEFNDWDFVDKKPGPGPSSPEPDIETKKDKELDSAISEEWNIIDKEAGQAPKNP